MGWSLQDFEACRVGKAERAHQRSTNCVAWDGGHGAKSAFAHSTQLTKVGWTRQYRIARSHHGRTILSPALGVMIGFIIWAVIISASIIFYSYT